MGLSIVGSKFYLYLALIYWSCFVWFWVKPGIFIMRSLSIFHIPISYSAHQSVNSSQGHSVVLTTANRISLKHILNLFHGKVWPVYNDPSPHTQPMGVAIWMARLQCPYNMVKFIQHPHKRHPIACLLEQDMGCPLWVQTLPQTLLRCM